MREGGHFGRVVEEEREDGRVIVAVDDKPKTLESEPEIPRVEGETLETLLALSRENFTGDETEGGGNLDEDGGSGGFAVNCACVGDAEFVDDVLVRSNVAAVGAKGLGERAHENVNFLGVNAKVVADAAAAGTEGTDRVGFVDKEVELVALLELNEGGEIAHCAFHGVEAFDDDENLLPGTVSAGLALRDAVAENALEVLHVVVLKHGNHGTRETGAEAEGRVVQFVRDEERAFGDKGRESSSVGSKAHGENHGIRLAHEFGNELLDVGVKVQGAGLGASARRRHAIFPDSLFSRISAGSLGLGKAEIIVRAHVESLGLSSGKLEGEIVVVRGAVEEGNVAARDTSDGTVEAVVDSHL